MRLVYQVKGQKDFAYTIYNRNLKTYSVKGTKVKYLYKK